MKRCIKILGLLVVAFLTFSACSEDDDPADNILFADRYKGTISYSTTDDDEDVTAAEGTVTVTKVGNLYNFAFSNGIPNINGVEFEQRGDNYYWNIGGSATSYIKINADELFITYIRDGKTWFADCDRD
jgi:hypothetical protein